MLEIRPLTGLRGLCAVWVMLFHAFFCPRFLGTPLDWITSAGYMGVNVFFVLSGFVLAYNYANSTWTPRSYLLFLRKRFARIYPLHAFMLLVFVFVTWLVSLTGVRLLPPAFTGLPDLVRALLLVHAWDAVARFPWNGPSWTISAEWAAYLVFPLVAWVATRIQTAAVAVTLVVLLYVLFAAWFHHPSLDLGVARRLPQLASSFCAGVLLWRLASLTPRTLLDDKVATLVLVLLIFGASASNMIARADVAAPRFAIVAAAVVYFVARSDGWLGRFLSMPVMLHLGRISYSLYLVHILLMYLSDIIIPGSRLPWLIRVAAVALAVICAHCLYTWIEEPFRKVLTGSRPPVALSNPQKLKPLGTSA
ncbi:MAG: acyltransferase [Gammaproteobacteria bacterium]